MVKYADTSPWVFEVENVELYLDSPIAVDAEMRSHLDAFEGKDLNKAWGLFVQTTRRLTEQDFKVLTK